MKKATQGRAKRKPAAKPMPSPKPAGKPPAKRGPSTKSRAPVVKRKDAPKDVGRLPADINPKVVAGMAFAGSTNEEIANFCNVSTDTIERRFAGILSKNRAGRKFRLRKLQTNRAVAGSDTMLIWLGKQELGQKDLSRLVHEDPEGKPLPIPEVRIVLVKPGGEVPAASIDAGHGG